MSTEIDTAPALTESQARALFEMEFVPHMDAMYNFALRLTNDEDDAHDLVQDTCMRAFRLKAIELVVETGNANGAFADLGLNDIILAKTKLFNGIGNEFPFIFLGCHSR